MCGVTGMVSQTLQIQQLAVVHDPVPDSKFAAETSSSQ